MASASIIVGEGGLPKVVLSHPSGSEAQVYLYGASLTSWVVQGVQQLFLSKQSIFNGTNAIRGGIPIVFPQFAQLGPLKQHGFARNKQWSFSRASFDNDVVELQLTLSDNQETRSEWAHAFALTYTVILGAKTLTTRLTVVNRNNTEPFSFTTALHTYFAADKIEAVRIHNLTGKTYTDKLREAKKFEETREAVSFAEETDRIYHNIDAAATFDLRDESTRRITIKNEGFTDAVVWNPWIIKSKAMADFADEEYQNMFCVEVATIDAPIVLAAGQSWTGGQVLTANS